MNRESQVDATDASKRSSALMGEKSAHNLLSVDQAIAILDHVEVRPRVETVPLYESSGRVAAADILSDRDYPPFDKSLMDGYAVMTQSIGEKWPVALPVVGAILAGQQHSKAIPPGCAVAIMTGAPLPPGVDAIVPVEQTRRLEDGRVQFLQPVNPGRYIAARGGDLPAGQPVIRVGQRLGAAPIAAAATVGAELVRVYEKPRVAILCTGDELVEGSAIPRPEQIRNSNLPMLQTLLGDIGCAVVGTRTIPDDRQRISDAIQSALDEPALDALFITGGMSMGATGYVPDVLVELGAELRITKLRMKPGKPFLFGGSPYEEGPHWPVVFGLPGNPVSAYVCGVRLAMRVLNRMQGRSPEPEWISAPLASALDANGPREFYQPAVLRDGLIAPLSWKGSGDIFTLASAGLLLKRAESEPAQRAGAMVRAIRLP